MRRALAGLAAVLLCSAAPAAASSGWGGRITVKVGQTLSGIAQHYGVSFQTLARANGLDWRRPLPAGIVLRVPLAQALAGRWSGLYVVRSGDTLSGIALHYHVTLAQIVSVNAIDPSKPLWVGVRLRVPSPGSLLPDLTAIEETDVYPQGTLGYDISYPNCTSAPPDPGGFAVIGLNGGRPFTSNPCFASEWTDARPARSVYINSAYSATMLDQVRPGCRALGRAQPLAPQAQRAFGLGCGEAAAALRQLAAVTPAPAGIWVDVERANTWSSHRNLNVATIEGMLDELLTSRPGALVGVYSTRDSWFRIVGDWDRLNVPEWIGTTPGSPGCPTGFSSGPVWLSQSIDQALDVDVAC